MKKWCVSVSLAFCLASAQPVTWTFEEGLGGWKSWGTKPDMGDTSGFLKIVSDEPHGGKKCLAIIDPTEKGNPYGVAVVAVDPEKTYEWSGFLKAESSGPAGAHVWAMPVSRTTAGDRNLKFAGVGGFDRMIVGTSWQSFRVTLPRMSAETTHVYLCVRPAKLDDPAWQGKISLDDVVFQAREFRALGLAPVANRGFQDDTPADGKGGWTDQGDNDLRGMVPGDTNLGGVVFSVLDPSKNGGRSVVALRPENASGFLDEASIAATGRADYLYLLHAAAWASPGTAVGRILWQYADGTEKETSITSGEEVGDWWHGLARKALARDFTAVNPQKSPVYLFTAGIPNPEPAKELKAVRLKAAPKGKAMWLVLAASLGTGDNAVALSQASARDTRGWLPFSTGIAAVTNPLLDLSFLLDAPAGKHGFTKSIGGHFAFEDGSPARFMAVNIHSANGLLPSHEQAARVAGTLARYGINLVRLHLMEYVLVDGTTPDRQTPAGADTWDRFDFLVKSLIERGIYVELDSVAGLSARKFSEKGDGLIGGDQYFQHRAWAAYHPRLRELGKAWAKTLLTHTNAYLGKALVEEPGVAMVMLINEQSLFFDWKEASSPTPPAVRALLTARWNGWLQGRYKDRAALARAWSTEDGKSSLKDGEDPARGNVDCWEIYGQILSQNPPSDKTLAPRLATLTRFLKELQVEHYRDFLAFFKALGLKVPMAPSNIHYDLAELETELGMGFTSQNRYYEHMKQVGSAYGFPNIPEVLRDPLSPGDLVHPGIAAVKIAGMPVTATEHDSMWPQEWRSTHNLSVYATAAHQDWDAIFWYSFMGGYGLTWDAAEKMDGVAYPTVEFNDPAMAGLLPAAALMFLRRDVAPAKNVVQVIHDPDLALETRRRLEGGFPWNLLTWVTRVEGAFGKGDGKAAFTVGPTGAASFPFGKDQLLAHPRDLAVALDGALKKSGVVDGARGIQDGRIVSDTGEITRDFSKGLLTIHTPRTQALSGFPKGPVTVGDIGVELSIPFATVVVQSLENAPIVMAKRLLVTAVARAENARDEVTYGRTVATPNGFFRGEGLMVTPKGKQGVGSPMRIEPVAGFLSIKGGDLRVTAIGGNGAPLGAPAVVASKDGQARIPMGSSATIWYLVERI